MAKRTYRTPEDNITFNMVDQHTVDRLRKDKKIALPAKRIYIPKDMRWNEKQMASKVLQGIENGDSIPKIADSLKSVIGNNDASAIRNARTMVTSAENHGRLDSYRELERQGVIQKKVWMATADDRVRPSHRDIDGEEQDIDKPFSNGCMFPADARAPAEEVWNCRCAMGDKIIGFKKTDGSVARLKSDHDKSLLPSLIAAGLLAVATRSDMKSDNVTSNVTSDHDGEEEDRPKMRPSKRRRRR